MTALETRVGPSLRVLDDAGVVIDLGAEAWLAEPTGEEHDLLDLVVPSVLDVGCGPAQLEVGAATGPWFAWAGDRRRPSPRRIKRRSHLC